MQRYQRILLSTSLALLLVAMPTYAVEIFKVSNYGGGAQIWFEAEAFDERGPQKLYQLREKEAKLPLTKGAFGDAITNPTGQGGDYLRYDFDIRKAKGKGGEWFLWGRVINPSNQSDWLWIKEKKDDPVPTKNPGGFVEALHRVFEADVAAWAWDGGAREGHRRKLLDGENTMVIFWRQSNNTDQWDVFMWTDNSNYRPTDDDYKNAKEMSAKPVEPTGKLATVWSSIKSAR